VLRATTDGQAVTACPLCGEEDCILHRGVVMLAQLVSVMLGLAALIGSIAVGWTWAFRDSTF
jgi:hypothetical protein